MPITLNGTLGIDAPLGTSSVPSYGNTTNTNTGLYFPSSTTLGLATNGTAALTIDASQNVGIGMSSPAVKLDINGTNPSVRIVQTVGGYENYLGVDSGNLAWNGSTNGTSWGVKTNNVERMRIDTSGNVGIGTTTINNRLVVQSSSAEEGITIRGNGFDAIKIGMVNPGVSNDGIISVKINNALRFSTNDTERMRIDSSGNVGIGTTTNYQMNNTSTTPKQMIAMTNNTGLNILRYNGFGGNGAFINLGASGGASLGTYSGAVASSGLGSINFGGDNGTNYNGNGAQIYAAASETWTTSTNAGYLVFLTTPSGSVSPAERMRIDSGGNLLVGTTSAVRTLTVNGSIYGISTSAGTETLDIRNSATSGTRYLAYWRVGASATIVGSINSDGTNTTYSTSSDYRLKENVQPMTTGLSKISALKPVTYDWISDKSAGEGFIAHELQSVIPLAVTGEKDAVDGGGNIMPQGVDYSKIVVHLVAAMQEQQAQITSLKAELDSLKGTK